MKRSIYIGILLAVMAAGFGCTDDVKYTDVRVYPSQGLLYPADNHYLELRSGAGVTQTFRWEAASAQDGDKVQYEVVFFDHASGGKEVARVDAGFGTSVEISHKVINRAAGTAGIETASEGEIYWTVAASRGSISVMADAERRQVTVKRLMGFNFIPAELYITGGATETGTELENARQFSNISAAGDEGEFQIFTRLSGSGNFTFVDGKESGARSYCIENDILSESSAGTASPSAGIYLINLDFNIRAYTIQKVENMRFVFCIRGNQPVYLDYMGDGVWQKMNVPSNFENGWKDDRYFFRVDIDGANQKLGSINVDNSSAPGSTTGSFYNVYFAPEGNPDWDYSFKVLSGSGYHGSTGKLMNIYLYMNDRNDNNHYYNYIEYLE